MAQQDEQDWRVRFDCVCGQELKVRPEQMGKSVRCPECRRYLRPALHYLLVDPEFAPNLTVQCICGRFVVQKPSKVGKTVVCPACKQRLRLPEPVYREDSGGVIRVPPAVLKKQRRRFDERMRGRDEKLGRLRSAFHAGTIRLRPGENICVNPDCDALLPAGANVCMRCGTNFTTGLYYEGPGPEADPVGRWKAPRKLP